MAGCEPHVQCGPGTYEENGVCLPGSGLLEPCEEVLAGDFLIEDQDDVDALAHYCAVSGDLIVKTATPSFSLSSLREVGGTLAVYESAALTSFDLPVLDKAGSLLVTDNPALSAFEAPALSTVGNLSVFENDALTHFSFPKVYAVNSSLKISGNDVLTHFELSGLLSVGNNLFVTSNEDLSGLDLSSLQEVTNHLVVEGNYALAQCLVDHLILQIEEWNGVGGDVTNQNNVMCSCSEIDGVRQASCL